MRCNFILSALASLAVMLAKLTITLRQEEITARTAEPSTRVWSGPKTRRGD